MNIFDSGSVGVDLGTSNVRIYKKGKGIVLNEPAVIAVDKNNGVILAVGEEARLMLGRTPRNIIAVRPLKDGVIANFHDTERMLKYFLKKVQGGKSFFKPKAVVCVPSGVTHVEKRSVVQASKDAGMQHAYLMKEPLAAAIGAGINVSAPFGNMIIDISAGTADVAVISLGSIVVSDSVKVAGDKFNEAIIQYVQKTHNMLIGASTAEQIKISVGAATDQIEEISMQVSGRNLISGLPKTIDISTNETVKALEDPLNVMTNMLLTVLEQVPPELSSDISESGICITGGGALLRGIDTLIAQKTGLKSWVAEDPMSCVAIGAGTALDNIDIYSKAADSKFRYY